MRPSQIFVSRQGPNSLATGTRLPTLAFSMPNKNCFKEEIVKAHYAGAVVLLVAAAIFLVVVFALNRALDLSRFAY